MTTLPNPSPGSHACRWRVWGSILETSGRAGLELKSDRLFALRADGGRDAGEDGLRGCMQKQKHSADEPGYGSRIELAMRCGGHGRIDEKDIELADAAHRVDRAVRRIGWIGKGLAHLYTAIVIAGIAANGICNAPSNVFACSYSCDSAELAMSPEITTR